MADNESVYIIPLIKTKTVPTTERSNRAIKEIRAYIARHMKAEEDSVWIDPKVNEGIDPGMFRVEVPKGFTQEVIPLERKQQEP